ncbi:high affinity copper uptake protein 1-like [Bradysia coprophila]|uniref:high affinity copper uptake protein 1-like n=1 Tax=Bradysia coprophila TaxID=38358 RepID=UPI00187D9A58|nr:high affinity copper uptake protein 1-like [Bradysia coprophila]XP_037039237.1 high affinity copper uptake protein 1-like [Bradysia coprophila]
MDYIIRQHGDHGDEGDSESCPMIMTFHTGNCESILFKGIKVTKGEEFAVAFLVIFVISIAYEGLRFWREKLYNDYQAQQQITCSNPKDMAPPRKTIRQLLTQKAHLIQTLMHMIQVTVSYALMLIVMTYNVWLVLAVILGATVGYFIFGWIRQRTIDVAESCCH